MACNCINIIAQSEECYAQMVTLPIPDHMQRYRKERAKEGLSELISIDPCIVEEVKELWAQGVITYGSCCGHNYLLPMIHVDASSIIKMLSMDYLMIRPDGIFLPKSV